MSSDTIIAIDLGRHNSVACIDSRATRAYEFRTLDTTPEDLARHPGAVVVVEACTQTGWVRDRGVPGGRLWVYGEKNGWVDEGRGEHACRRCDAWQGSVTR